MHKEHIQHHTSPNLTLAKTARISDNTVPHTLPAKKKPFLPPLQTLRRSNIAVKFLLPCLLFLAILLAWQFLVKSEYILPFVLPAPSDILSTVFVDFAILAPHLLHTLKVSALGILIALLAAFVLAIAMDKFPLLNRMLYPLILLFQIVPVIIFAPLFIIWFGYGMGTQLITVVLMVFFPILITLGNGFTTCPVAQINLLRTMGASEIQIYGWIKIPIATTSLFAGLRLAISYGITAAVISEWVGAIKGLGVIMIRSQKSFLITRVFAINLIIIFLSLLLYVAVLLLEKKLLPWKQYIYQKS